MKNVKKVNLDGLYEYIAMYEKIVKETQKKKNEYDVNEKKLNDVINKLIESGDLFTDKVKKRKEQKKTSEYKSLVTKKNEMKKDLYLLYLGKKVVKNNLEKLLELKIMECIALNWDIIKGVPFHYKKYSNVINESLSAEGLGYRVYFNNNYNTLKINNFYDPEIKGFKREPIDSYIYLHGKRCLIFFQEMYINPNMSGLYMVTCDYKYQDECNSIIDYAYSLMDQDDYD